MGFLASETSEVSDAELSYWSVTWAPKTNLVKFTRAACPVPSSRSTSIPAASPAALCSGSGSCTCTPPAAGGPPADSGNRKFQPIEPPNAGSLAATERGITIISGDRATSIPVGRMTWAPTGKLRATSVHRLESGIHAPMAGSPCGGSLPSTIAAAAAGCSAVTWTSAQRPPTWRCSRLKYCATRWTAGAMSSEAATLTRARFRAHETLARIAWVLTAASTAAAITTATMTSTPVRTPRPRLAWPPRPACPALTADLSAGHRLPVPARDDYIQAGTGESADLRLLGRAPPARAHQEERLQRLDQGVVARVIRPGPDVDRAGEQPVRGVDVAISVQQHVRGRHRGRQRLAKFRVGAARGGEQLRDAADFPGRPRSEVGGLGEPAAPAGAARAQVSSAQQRGYRAVGITAPHQPVRHPLEQARYLLIGPGRRCGQVPCLPFRLIGEMVGQRPVGPPPVAAGR